MQLLERRESLFVLKNCDYFPRILRETCIFWYNRSCPCRLLTRGQRDNEKTLNLMLSKIIQLSNGKLKYDLLRRILIHGADPKSRPVVIDIFARVVCTSVPHYQNLENKTIFKWEKRPLLAGLWVWPRGSLMAQISCYNQERIVLFKIILHPYHNKKYWGSLVIKMQFCGA